jgi:hypothetical protein
MGVIFGQAIGNLKKNRVESVTPRGFEPLSQP